eukprot:353590-Chlamydomonas_euryale.AAC.3
MLYGGNHAVDGECFSESASGPPCTQPAGRYGRQVGRRDICKVLLTMNDHASGLQPSFNLPDSTPRPASVTLTFKL